MYYKSILPSKRRYDIESSECKENEILVCELGDKTSKILIVGVYRPLNSGIKFTDNLSLVLNNIRSMSNIKNVIMLGDFISQDLTGTIFLLVIMSKNDYVKSYPMLIYNNVIISLQGHTIIIYWI